MYRDRRDILSVIGTAIVGSAAGCTGSDEPAQEQESTQQTTATATSGQSSTDAATQTQSPTESPSYIAQSTSAIVEETKWMATEAPQLLKQLEKQEEQITNTFLEFSEGDIPSTSRVEKFAQTIRSYNEQSLGLIRDHFDLPPDSFSKSEWEHIQDVATTEDKDELERLKQYAEYDQAEKFRKALVKYLLASNHHTHIRAKYEPKRVTIQKSNYTSYTNPEDIFTEHRVDAENRYVVLQPKLLSLILPNPITSEWRKYWHLSVYWPQNGFGDSSLQSVFDPVPNRDGTTAFVGRHLYGSAADFRITKFGSSSQAQQVVEQIKSKLKVEGKRQLGNSVGTATKIFWETGEQSVFGYLLHEEDMVAVIAPPARGTIWQDQPTNKLDKYWFFTSG